MDNRRKNEMIGIAVTLAGGIFWGFSGVCGQFLFTEKGLNTHWLVPVRLLIAGALMVCYSLTKSQYRSALKGVLTTPRDLRDLLLFGLLGMTGTQVTFFYCIEYSNAATAAVLQYTAPVFIFAVTAFLSRKLPRLGEFASLVLVVVGVFFLTTHGNPSELALSPLALVFGIGCAVAMTVYNMIPGRIMTKYQTAPIVGAGMLIGGIMMCLINQPWKEIPGIWDLFTVLAFAFIILFGTIAAFFCYLEGVRRIGATKASLYEASEPVSSTVFTICLTGVVFQPMDFVGLLMILVGVSLLTILIHQASGKKKEE